MFRWAALAVAAVAALALVWNTSEAHYRGCVEASTRYVVKPDFPGFTDASAVTISRRHADCSRLPW